MAKPPTWIDRLLSETIAITLPELTMRLNGQDREEGTGSITWKRGEWVRVDAVTKQLSQLPAAAARQAGYFGRLIPKSEYSQIVGRTPDNWMLKTAAYPIGERSISNPTGHQVWHFDTWGLTLESDKSQRGLPYLSAILTPAPSHWPRSSSRTHVDGFGDIQSAQPDWLSAELGFATLLARHKSADCFEMRLTMSEENGEFDVDVALQAVCDAFGFAIGRPIDVVGYEVAHSEKLTRALKGPFGPKIQGKVTSPFSGPAYMKQIETYLTLAVPFFMTSPGQDVAAFLHMWWDTADNSFPTRALVASVVVEGLVTLLVPKPVSVKADKLAGDILAAKAHLSKHVPPFEASFLTRAENRLESLSAPRTVDSLWRWQKAGTMDVTADMVRGWSKLRNSAAHAGSAALPADPAKTQAILNRLQNVESLIHRLMLQLVRFNGSFSPKLPHEPSGTPEKETPATVEFPLAADDEI